VQLNDFSVVSTNVELDTKSNIIKKTYSKNVEIDITTIELKELMDHYIHSLKVSNITIPEIVSSYIQDDKVVYECEFCGKNIVEAGLKKSNFDKFIPSITKMLKLINQAILNDLYFDPHPKNFVFNKDNNIFYVDFFPPYSDYLKSKRLQVAKTNEKQIISENYQFFTKDFLAAHFCGDFLNIDHNFVEVFDKIYAIVKSIGMYTGSLTDFTSEAKYVRHIEDKRLQQDIYLL
jgi:hypothetical protein